MAKIPDTKVHVETEIKTSGKPGVKTSEFWLTLVVKLVAILLIAYGMWKGSDGLVEFGGVVMALSSGAYAVGRSIEKAGAAKAIGQVAKQASREQ